MSKLVKIMMISLSVILIIGVATTVLVVMLTKETKADDTQSIDEMNEYSYATPEITTDLKDGRFVRIQFMVITDGKSALKEVEKREFQIQNLLIKEISLMSEADFSSGLSDLEKTIKKSLNDVMENGKITDVYTTNKILQ